MDDISILARIKFHLKSLNISDLQKVGLSQGSIIGNDLWQPHFASGEFYQVNFSKFPGLWFCRDFSNKEKPIRYGYLFSLLTEEMSNNEKDIYTPFLPINSIDLTARLSLTDSGFLLNKNLLEYKSYEDVYKSLGLFEKYGSCLQEKNILDERVLNVTPKGNGRIFCLLVKGNTKKGSIEKSLSQEFQYAF